MDIGDALIDGLRAALGVSAIAYALAAIGLNVQFGYTGLLNFGQVGFLLVGAYGTAISADRGVPLPLAFCVGVAAAVVLGLILGLPTLRLRADYLAIVTISVAEILRLVTRSRQLQDFTGGVFGLQGFASTFFSWNPIPAGSYGWGRLTFSSRTLWVMLVGWVLVALATLLTTLLVRSPWGRVLRSIREDEDAARSLGKNVFVMKLQSLVLGGVVAATAGMLLVLDAQAVQPDLWQSALTFFAYTALIIGGVGSILGPILGSMVFWFSLQFLDVLLRQAVEGDYLPDFIATTDVGPIRFSLVGLVLIALVVFRPQGLLGNREEALVIDR